MRLIQRMVWLACLWLVSPRNVLLTNTQEGLPHLHSASR